MKHQKSTQQIREEVRKEMTKKFEQKYQNLIEDCENFKSLYRNTCNENNELCKKISKLKTKNSDLEEKIHQYEDWIERLQSFMDIENEEERKAAYKQYVADKKLDDILNRYTKMFSYFL